MFSIISSSKNNSIEIKNSTTNTTANICLELGASLQELTLSGKKIIQESTTLDYKTSFASAILFPFPSRIENGTYFFNNKKYQLGINETKGGSALHGLVYNKTFTAIEQLATNTSAKITLQYTANGTEKGFPFAYHFIVTYTLTNDFLKMDIQIKNTDNQSFPFAIGWHPYFFSSNLHNSFLQFKSNKKAIFTENLILKKFEEVIIENPFKIGNKKLDDCYPLKENDFYFTTPDYKIAFTTTQNSFLQLFTPMQNKNVIAIEPITAPSNSFNNKIGLQVLDSQKEYNISWKVTMIKQ